MLFVHSHSLNSSLNFPSLAHLQYLLDQMDFNTRAHPCVPCFMVENLIALYWFAPHSICISVVKIQVNGKYPMGKAN